MRFSPTPPSRVRITRWAFTRRIPGLKRETWGTLLNFPSDLRCDVTLRVFRPESVLHRIGSPLNSLQRRFHLGSVLRLSRRLEPFLRVR
jgi:hypothetical protein